MVLTRQRQLELKTKILIKELLFYFFVLFPLFILITISCGCCKTIKVKTDTISGIRYIEPKQCKLRDISKIPYQAIIQENNIILSNQDANAFLSNFFEYKQAVKEFQQCTIMNEEYYKSIINILIDNNY